MATVIRREVRKRGFFGWVFMILFVLFNLFMLAWLLIYWSDVASMPVASDAQRAGRNVGATVATGMLVFFWVAGAVILGLFALLTRGRKTIVEETVQ